MRKAALLQREQMLLAIPARRGFLTEFTLEPPMRRAIRRASGSPVTVGGGGRKL